MKKTLRNKFKFFTLKKGILIFLATLIYFLSVYFLFFYSKKERYSISYEIEQLKQEAKQAEYLSAISACIDSMMFSDTNYLKEKAEKEGLNVSHFYKDKLDEARKYYRRKNENSDEANKTTLSQSLKRSVTPASITIAAYKFYTITNVEREEIAKTLMKNGVNDQYASKYSEQISKILRNRYVKRASVFIAATGAVLTVEEFLFPNLTFYQRLFIAISVGGLFLGLYIFMKRKGVMN